MLSIFLRKLTYLININFFEYINLDVIPSMLKKIADLNKYKEINLFYKFEFFFETKIDL